MEDNYREVHPPLPHCRKGEIGGHDGQDPGRNEHAHSESLCELGATDPDLQSVGQNFRRCRAVIGTVDKVLRDIHGTRGDRVAIHGVCDGKPNHVDW